ncbi:MAG: acylneuraminate cytidylyltransferase family protein [Coriobacteriia bacterium]|nr:acylneuraminate cytidylyltransferase family protein [Coriobacteriia bacterium]
MYDGKRVLGLIPARGGSKGLPGKNVRPLAGRPLIAWTVAAALASPSLDAVVVSTDIEGIADAARQAGAEVPFLRPPHLARDDSRMIDVVLDVVDTLANEGRDFELVVLLQPTSPLRTSEDVELALRELTKSGGHAIAAVCDAEHSPLLSGTLPPDRSLDGFLAQRDTTANRQELPAFYRLNGAVYVAELGWLRETGTFVGPGAFAHVMPQERSVDIDSELDFALAEFLLSRTGRP